MKWATRWKRIRKKLLSQKYNTAKFVPATRRVEKINKLLAKEVANLFLRELEFPEGIIATVIGVDTSDDLRYADVLVSVFPPEKTDTAAKLIKKNVYKLQKLIDRRLKMRPVPKLRFRLETAKTDHLEKIFERIKSEIN